MRIPVRAALAAAAACALLAGCQKIPFRLELDELVNPTPAWHKVTDSAPWGGRSGLQAVVHDNRIFVMGGKDGSGTVHNDVYSSTNGSDWTLVMPDTTPSATVPEQRQWHAACAHGGAIWIVAGIGPVSSYMDDAWSTTGGTTWAEAAAALPVRRYGCSATAFDGKLWVMGGYNGLAGALTLNDVLHTTDGSSWQAEPAAGWPVRFGHAAVVFGGNLWVLGGGKVEGPSYTTSVYRDAWHTTDGQTWSSAATPAWSAREGHTAVVFNGEIWLVGGFDSLTTYSAEAWRSTDGATWTQVEVPSGFPARAWHACVVFGDRLWVFGGSKGLTAQDHLADIWYYGR